MSSTFGVRAGGPSPQICADATFDALRDSSLPIRFHSMRSSAKVESEARPAREGSGHGS